MILIIADCHNKLNALIPLYIFCLNRLLISEYVRYFEVEGFE